jgi:hypothetical protein
VETQIAEAAELDISGGTRIVAAGDLSAASNASFAATMFLAAFKSFVLAEVAAGVIPVSDGVITVFS